MASTIRYYLEQSVPELEDLTKKGLFERKEITMVMRRRTDFEHRIQGRGATPRDYLKYAAFEINLERLRIKRYLRLNTANLVDTKPSLSDWAGFRRIVFVFDRAVRRFPGNLDIWAEYIKFVREKDAVKVVYRVYAKLLQLQPRNVDAWLLAAKYEFEENANAKGARDLYQRGLRFNPESTRLWMSYAQFELTYVAKLLARRKVLGLLTDKQQQDDLQLQQAERESRLASTAVDVDGVEENHEIIALGDDDEDELKLHLHTLPEADLNVLGNPDLNPVLRGDVALAIFDLCVAELLKDVPADVRQTKVLDIASDFLAVVDQFDSLNRDHLYVHVLAYLQNSYPDSVRTKVLDITLPLRTVAVDDADLAELLQLAVNKFLAYKLKMHSSDDKQALTADFVAYLTDRYVNTAKSAKTVLLLKAIIHKCR